MTARFDRRRSIAGSPELVAGEIRDLECGIARFRSGELAEAVFLESRLRHGIYGQRQDGVHMLRSKLPLGVVDAPQLEAFADVAERYGSGVAHLTTRQDIQVHFVDLDRTPALLRALDAADMTSREACGNVVRNVTAVEDAGTSPAEAFDVTPHGMALAEFLLRHPDGQSLGRKFKVHVAGGPDPRRNLAAIHDLGLTAVLRGNARGFEVKVGGGLGPVPYEARVLTDFLPEAELLPLAQSVLRVFSRHGEKRKRARARLKFLVADWGIERFRAEVQRVRRSLAEDPAWQSWLDDLEPWRVAPRLSPGREFPVGRDDDEATWLRTAVELQRQPGYAAVTVRVPRGDLSPTRLRGLAEILRAHSGDRLRITPEQGLYLRFVPFERLLPLRLALVAIGLGEPRPGGLGDPVTCPGADTCKLGITSPRSASRSMTAVLDELAADPRLERLRIHISGCPNACAQHHVADIGLFGAARTVGGVSSPHYMLVLGGLAGGAAGDGALGSGFGTPVAKLPAARIGDAVRRLCAEYVRGAREGEAFGRFARRLGREHFGSLLADLRELPPASEAPELYREFGSDRPFAVRRGTGECAGAVVDHADLLLADADREASTAVQALEHAQRDIAIAAANAAFLLAARGLLSTERVHAADAASVAREFRRRFYDTDRIYEGVGHTFLAAVREVPGQVSGDRLRRLVIEAGLFVEEAHSILAKLREAGDAR